MSYITDALIKKFAPRAKAKYVRAIVDHAEDVLPDYGITTPRRLQHFFAQIAHETGGFTIFEENMRYTAKRMTEVWPRRFPNIAAAAPYANNPEKLGSYTYANRMGNGQPSSGDGYRYRGRSFAQHTGKDGYRAVGKITGLDLIENPDQVLDQDHALECAAAFWKWKRLQGPADRDDIVGVTKLWNGGTIGLADRRVWLAKAKRIFTEPLSDEEPDEEVASLSADDEDNTPTDLSSVDMRRGIDDPDPDLEQLQKNLKEMNYSPGVPDGIWGSGTVGALSGFMTDRVMGKKAPTQLFGFRAMQDEIEAEVAEALAEDPPWRRPVSDARAEAAPEILHAVAPEEKNVARTEKIGIIGTITMFFSGLYAAAKEQLRAAWDFFFGDGNTGLLSDIWDFLASAPGWLWFALGVGVFAYLATEASKAKTKITDSVKSGERM